MKYAWREKEYSHRASVNHVAVLSLPASCESIVLLTFFAGRPPSMRAATCEGIYTVAFAAAGDTANVGRETP